MAKTISNKKYEEFWNNDDLEIKSEQKLDNKSDANKDDIKKQVKREVKKEVKKLEDQVKELTEKIDLSDVIEKEQHKKKKNSKTKLKNIKDLNNNKIDDIIIDDIVVEKEVEKEIEKIDDIIIEKEVEKTDDIIIEKEVEKTDEIVVEKEVEEVIVRKNIKRIINRGVTINNDVIIKEVQPILSLTNKDLYERYSLDEQPYKIFFRGNLIYNSINHKEKPIFQNDGFIIFGKKYIYRGVRFEKY
jgi:hypothetical protein